MKHAVGRTAESELGALVILTEVRRGRKLGDGKSGAEGAELTLDEFAEMACARKAAAELPHSI